MWTRCERSLRDGLFRLLITRRLLHIVRAVQMRAGSRVYSTLTMLESFAT
jgi:hypothetical protein